MGTVEGCTDDGLCTVVQRNKFSVGERIEAMKPDGRNLELTVLRILDEAGREMDCAPHPQQKLYIDLGTSLECYDILRRKEEAC